MGQMAFTLLTACDSFDSFDCLTSFDCLLCFSISQIFSIFNNRWSLINSIATLFGTKTILAMQKFTLQKRLGPYTIDKSLLQHIESYINRNIPRILLLNLEKGKENPLSAFITITIQKQHGKETLRSIDEYGYELFNENIEEVSVELVHNNAFNFWGQKVIVLIMTFDIKSGYCDMSVALSDEEPHDKIYIIEKGLRSVMSRHKKTLPLARFFRS
jgi:hypothetical protein